MSTEDKKEVSIKSLTEIPFMLYMRKRGPSLTLLILGIALINLPVLWNGFVHWDDKDYVLYNPYIKTLSWENIFLMFTSSLQNNYHPLVQLSYALDYKIAGVSPWIYHAQNLAWHLLNTLLVYGIFRRLGYNRTKGWLIALFFGIHPMHAESVAWVASRKDVMYAAGFLFSILYYYRYSVTGKTLFYRMSLFGFVWACLCKPMAMSLPLLLPLIDYFSGRKDPLRSRVIEKFPFFFVGGVLAWFTLLAQMNAGYIAQEFDQFHPGIVARGILFYITRTILPLNLSAYYPFPEETGFMEFLAPVVLIILLLLFFKLMHLSKVTIFGVFFFLICLLPVLQIVPYGPVWVADRYHYIAGLGLFFIFVEFAWIAWYRFPRLRNVIPIACAGIVIFFTIIYMSRLRVWSDSENLYADMLLKHPDKYLPNKGLADARYEEGKFKLALPVYMKLTKDYPDSVSGYSGAAHTWFRLGKYAQVVRYSGMAIQKSPEPELYYELTARAWLFQQKWDSAAKYYTMTLKSYPKNITARHHLAQVYMGMEEDALAQFTLYQILNMDSNFTPAYFSMGDLWAKKGDFEKSNSWKSLALQKQTGVQKYKQENYFIEKP